MIKIRNPVKKRANNIIYKMIKGLKYATCQSTNKVHNWTNRPLLKSMLTSKIWGSRSSRAKRGITNKVSLVFISKLIILPKRSSRNLTTIKSDFVAKTVQGHFPLKYCRLSIHVQVLRENSLTRTTLTPKSHWKLLKSRMRLNLTATWLTIRKIDQSEDSSLFSKRPMFLS